MSAAPPIHRAPAVFINCFTLTYDNEMARLDFREGYGDAPASTQEHRTAICMSLTNLRALQSLLNIQLAEGTRQ